MPQISKEAVNEIVKKTDIVEIISEHVNLDKRGKNYFAICPIHKGDTSPSFCVSSEKQIFQCFSCKAKGNVITYLMDVRHMEYIECVKYLADKAGIRLDLGNYQSKRDLHSEDYEIYELLTKYYQNYLNTASGVLAKEYLDKRKINDEVIKEFRIGLASNDITFATKFLEMKSITNKKLVDLGISNKNDYGYNDIFINRIIFPLCNEEGKVIAYSGRIYDGSDTAKYINTKETPIFRKGNVLYNYHVAKNNMGVNDLLIIVEGFLDVIRCYTIGIKNVVAIMGTALTASQSQMIKKLTTNVIICLDGDEPGGNASLASATELNKIGIMPKIVRLEENLDPDDYILKYGKDKFNIKLENAISLLDFKIERLKKGKNMTNAEDLADYLSSVIEEISKEKNEILVELLLNRIASETKVDIQILRKRLDKLDGNVKKKAHAEDTFYEESLSYFESMVGPPIGSSVKEEAKIKPTINKNFKDYEKPEKRLIYLMLHHTEVISTYDKKEGYMPSLKYRNLATELIKYYLEHKNIDLVSLIEHLKENDEIISVIKEVDSFNEDLKFSNKEVEDYIVILKRVKLLREIERLKKAQREENDIDRKIEIGNKVLELEIEKEKLMMKK